VLRTQPGLKVLGPSDLPEVLGLLATDPVRNVFVEYRARLTRLDPRWLGGEAWGFYEGGELRSVCHAAANLVPVLGDDAALAAFAHRATRRGRVCSTIVGPQDQVRVLWQSLGERWGTPREARWDQPHLEMAREPAVAPDPLVRRSEQADVDALYPACVDMYTEEVGISPEWDGGRDLYRARVNQLVSRGWSFARYEQGRVAEGGALHAIRYLHLHAEATPFPWLAYFAWDVEKAEKNFVKDEDERFSYRETRMRRLSR